MPGSAQAASDQVAGDPETGGPATAPRPPLIYRITLRQWLAVDIVTAVTAMLVMMFSLRVRAPHAAMPTVGMAAAVTAATLPVALRRLWPLPVLVVVTTAIAVLTGVGRAPLVSDVMLGMAIYMAAVRLPRAAAVVTLAAAETAILAGVLAAAATAHQQNELLHSMLAAAAMWFVGFGVRERRTYRTGLAEQAAQRERNAAERSRHALQEERLRIARELHDVLAHTLSVVTLQAGVGRRVGAARPAEALRALATVEEASRGALDELRRMLCLLRSDDEPGLPAAADPAAFAPAPGLGDLSTLAAMVRSAGTPVALDVTGDAAAVPAVAALTAYRIVQEALTNVVRHAPGADAAVQVAVSGAGVRIRVTDTGRPPGIAASAIPPAAGSPAARSPAGQQLQLPQVRLESGRHGIIGMRERAAMFGGTLSAGPLPGGGFQVAAFLPVLATVRAPLPATATGDPAGRVA